MTKEEQIRKWIEQGRTMGQIGRLLDVSRQRVYQLMEQYGIPTLERRKDGFWGKQSPEHRGLWRTLVSKPLTKDEKWALFEHLKDRMPTHCPILGLPLSWSEGTRNEGSFSIDRVDSTKGYTPDNVHIISWRANRIKNDSTLEELEKLVEYLKSR